MTARALLSPRAQADLDEIWNHTVQTWGIDQAETYLRQIWQRIERAAENPAVGRACPEIRRGYYKLAGGSHILFYRRIDNGIEVIRILHSRMDASRHLT